MAARFGRNKARRAREALQAERDYSADLIESLRRVSIQRADLLVEMANVRQALIRHCPDVPAFAIGLVPSECRDRMPLPSMVELALSKQTFPRNNDEEDPHYPATEPVPDRVQQS